jgi:outer membrane protein assembly factor BamA
VGGSGADTLIDSSRTRHSRFYDSGDATVAVGRGVDRRRYSQPADTNPAALPERDWGSKTVGFPTLYGSSDLGIAAGYSWTRHGYGFRRQPYASRVSIGGEYSTGRSSGRFRFDSRWKLVNRDRYITLAGLASGIESLHFYGFGNDSEDTASTRFYRVHNRTFSLSPGIGWGLEGPSRLHIRLEARHTKTDLDNPDNQGPIAELAPYGTGEFGQAGVLAQYEWDSRDYPNLPTRGLKLRVESAYYPLVWSDADEGFGTLDGMIGAFVSPGNQEWLTFAFRAGGRHTYGDVPYFEAAYLGGTQSLRGYPRDRFAGESAVFGSAEVRLRLGRAFLIIPGEIGVFGLADGGRVFVDSDTDSGDWQTNAGGGVFFAVLKRSTVISLGAAQGNEGARFYLGLGMGY